MARSLFFGADAVDSILPLVSATDARLFNLAKQKHALNEGNYSPWMAIPSTMIQSPLNTDWFPKNRFFNTEESTCIKSILASVNQNNDLIPSHERYAISVSNLNETETGFFNERITKAEAHLTSHLPHFKALIDHLVKKYIPMENTVNSRGDFGMSTLWFKGAVFLEKSQSTDLGQRAENLAHEIAHQIIIHYQLNDSLIEGDLNSPVYSGIREELRPAILSFHGAAALSYMLWFRTQLGDSQRASNIKDQLEVTLEDLRNIRFTTIGRKIYEEFHEPLKAIRT